MNFNEDLNIDLNIVLKIDLMKRVKQFEINERSALVLEGGAYRTALGTLIRYACIKAQPGAAQFMLFDESFFAFSDATTAVMKEIFEKMKQDMLIICIEQRRNVMDGISDQEYLFSKGDDGTTTVKRVF